MRGNEWRDRKEGGKSGEKEVRALRENERGSECLRGSAGEVRSGQRVSEWEVREPERAGVEGLSHVYVLRSRVCISFKGIYAERLLALVTNPFAARHSSTEQLTERSPS